MNTPSVVLRKGKDKAVRNRHHWVFSGAVERFPEFEDGTILAVRSWEGELLGHGYFNKKCSLTGRMVSFGPQPPLEAIGEALESAVRLRGLFAEETTTAFRLVNGEGDRLPGLIVDRYGDTLVIQVATLGMEKLKPRILDFLLEKFSPRSVYEKSSLPSRREEGLPDAEGLLHGEMPGRVEIMEHGLRFLIDIVQSQKTGLFLDQREMRRLVGGLSRGRNVLDCFSYSGGFSVHALNGGARSVVCVDVSEKALEQSRENIRLNGFDPEGQQFIAHDVFQFLRDRDTGCDLVVLDPPAFAKKRTDVVQACRGYKDINRLAMQKMPPGSLLFTSSCSHYVDDSLFQQVLFQAASEAGRNARLLQRHRQAFDHPVNIFHPESHYLKGFLLWIE
ncbi:MAG: 50S rRNA methyltransferase [Candidatus Aminicenantes bacterium RBG_13_59_9]|nr:MAG: 50S rRNA methyltransferase [Candidatus Aminicenantes bacterium RBG_13_59_9]